ncbi:ROK family protein [Taklimakanibacter lacteus]|uniref:ROK family protein n=1 Tax=Taklimakanibacter lacteus TaxID=2268456 RepID=UPI000E66E2CA
MSNAIGIDIGGSKTAVGLINLDTGNVLAEEVFDTPDLSETGQPYVDRLQAIVAHMREEAEVSKIGIGLCELVDNQGRIVSAHRVDVTDAQLRDAFYDFETVVIESDVHAAALAEARFGAGRDMKQWVYVNAGTGISSVLMRGSDCYNGAHGWAICLGMSPIDLANGRDSGAPDIIEDRAGGAGLVREAREAGLAFETAADLIAAAARGETKATRVLEKGGHVLGNAIGFLVNMLDPQRVVVGGGLVSFDGPYWRAIGETARSSIWHRPAKDVPILQSLLKGRAGMIGAALANGRL